MEAKDRVKAFEFIKDRFKNDNRMQVFKHTWNELEDILTDFANQPSIVVEEDGVTVMKEPHSPPFYDEQDRINYNNWEEAERITVEEHNKRLKAEIERKNEVIESQKQLIAEALDKYTELRKNGSEEAKG